MCNLLLFIASFSSPIAVSNKYLISLRSLSSSISLSPFSIFITLLSEKDMSMQAYFSKASAYNEALKHLWRASERENAFSSNLLSTLYIVTILYKLRHVQNDRSKLYDAENLTPSLSLSFSRLRRIHTYIYTLFYKSRGRKISAVGKIYIRLTEQG